MLEAEDKLTGFPSQRLQSKSHHAACIEANQYKNGQLLHSAVCELMTAWFLWKKQLVNKSSSHKDKVQCKHKWSNVQNQNFSVKLLVQMQL